MTTVGSKCPRILARCLSYRCQGTAVVRIEYGVAQQPFVGRPLAPPQPLTVVPEQPELGPVGQLRGVVKPRCILPTLHELQSGQLIPCGLNLGIEMHNLSLNLVKKISQWFKYIFGWESIYHEIWNIIIATLISSI